MKKNSFFRSNPWAFAAVPAAFALLTAIVVAVVTYIYVHPYIGLFGMIATGSSSSTVEVDDSRDLLALREEGSASPSASVRPSKSPSASPSGSPERDKIDLDEETMPSGNDRYGKLSISGTEVSCDLFYGTDNSVLDAGAGTYEGFGAGIPGENCSIFIMAHNNTYFNDLKSAKVGATVTITTHYGDYVYRVVDTAIVENTDSTAYDLSRTDENLILYTCYPFDALGFTSQRYLVYCEFVSGPEINE